MPLDFLPRRLFFAYHRHLPDLHSFPTRRSSDLSQRYSAPVVLLLRLEPPPHALEQLAHPDFDRAGPGIDRKSTRLNSSHVAISYAVFCLKKKNRSSEG